MADSALRILPPDLGVPELELVPRDFASPTLVLLAVEGSLTNTSGTLALCGGTSGLGGLLSIARGRGSDELLSYLRCWEPWGLGFCLGLRVFPPLP